MAPDRNGPGEQADNGSATPEKRRGGSIFIADFHSEGNSGAFRTFGWSGQEFGHIWSIRGSCGLRVPAPHDHTSLVVELDFNISTGRPFVKAAVVRVFANGHPVGSACAMGWTRLRCHIPAALLTPGEAIELRFEHPSYVRMDFLDGNGDDRALGLCFFAVRVYPPWLTEAVGRLALKPPDGRIIQARSPQPEATHASPEKRIYSFAADAAGAAMLRDGWLHDSSGDAWLSSRVGTLELPALPEGSRYLARFTLCPLYIRSFLTSQRINILLSGAVIGQFRVCTETSLTVPLPPELLSDTESLRFTLAAPDGLPNHKFSDHGDGTFLSFLLDSVEILTVPPRHAALAAVRDDDVSPATPMATSDCFLNETVGELPDAVKRETGLDINAILRQFESLGDNCAFGLAQRKSGCEILGLLRFGNTPLQSLYVALDDEFRAADDNSQVNMTFLDGKSGEYLLFINRYGIRWHTNVFGGPDADEAVIYSQQTMRLSYLRRKFYEALRAGRKILTISRAEPRKHPIPLRYAGEPQVWEENSDRLCFAEVLPLFLQLNEYGANTLLYLTRCAHGRRSGTVELIAPGIMRGYVDDFVITPNVEQNDHAAWLRVAVNAWLLDQGPNASFRNKPAS
jgi:hypothetical protein